MASHQLLHAAAARCLPAAGGLDIAPLLGMLEKRGPLRDASRVRLLLGAAIRGIALSENSCPAAGRTGLCQIKGPRPATAQVKGGKECA